MTPAFYALATALTLQAGAAQSAPEELASLELLRAGDRQCSFFEDAERALLDAAISRTRNDLVLAGLDPESIQVGPNPSGLPACDDPVLQALREGHRARTAELAQFTELTFPGQAGRWWVDRTPPIGARATAEWRVVQTQEGVDAAFGVFDAGEGPSLGFAFRADARPARAELAWRNSQRQSAPIDFTAGGLLAPPDNAPAASWGAGARAQSRTGANARVSEQVAANLAPAGGQSAYGFVFDDAVVQTLADLTPREGFVVIVYDARGEVSQRVWFEVGGLKAALAMQAIELVIVEPEPQEQPAP